MYKKVYVYKSDKVKMRYSYMSDNRLTLSQFYNLTDIMDYLESPRPELSWAGLKRERRGLSKAAWHRKISYELYEFYRIMYPTEEFTPEHVDDFFDEAYIDNLVSFKQRVRDFFCCRRSVVM